MKKFINKNCYSILLTLLDDDPYWVKNISEEDFGVEFQKTLSSLSRTYQWGLTISILLLSIVPPPYSSFRSFSKLDFNKRKKWLNSWANSQYTWKKSLFLGLRILIMGSALQLKPTLIHTNYFQVLEEREKQVCFMTKNNL